MHFPHRHPALLTKAEEISLTLPCHLPSLWAEPAAPHREVLTSCSLNNPKCLQRLAKILHSKWVKSLKNNCYKDSELSRLFCPSALRLLLTMCTGTFPGLSLGFCHKESHVTSPLRKWPVSLLVLILLFILYSTNALRAHDCIKSPKLFY